MKKILAGLAVSISAGLMSAPASAIVVSNIDFGSGFTTHLETATFAQQWIDPATTAPGTGSGWGYGYITTVNGDTNYCGVGSCALYYTVNFTGGTFLSPTQVTFTGTNVSIYYSGAGSLNLLAANSPTNLATIQALTPYATLIGHGDLGGGLPSNVVSFSGGTLSGASLNLFGNGLLDVDMTGPGNAAFADFLNTDGMPDAATGMADIAYTESANNFVLNPRDVADGLALGCNNGTAKTGAWCWQGTMNTRGVIPEPGTLALMSLGLLGFAYTRRRKV